MWQAYSWPYLVPCPPDSLSRDTPTFESHPQGKLLTSLNYIKGSWQSMVAIHHDSNNDQSFEIAQYHMVWNCRSCSNMSLSPHGRSCSLILLNSKTCPCPLGCSGYSRVGKTSHMALDMALTAIGNRNRSSYCYCQIL